ncbi:DUF2797 domain-containing protein [Streptomyces sp. J2-1]|uniref:DUF2797 domain-containing protein n=1 Tax=Streptomyces corallincola TaxID=2851888 RepID=UPI001C38EF28|nr:DUF2797 domain-containing protein [Streptomyces corallincola]MBV2356868.1 DUF2797 domain-containing protein [Streptomyces corallincola]
MPRTWTSAGLRWSPDAIPALTWGGGRRSVLVWGQRVGFGVADGGGRRCVGAKGNVCPVRAGVSGRGTGARCEECARLDRAHSVAADTLADDPRPYRVYLAWFGPGLLKVGITARERGAVRLLEQGAVCFTWLGTGPLMAARRTEELLRAALGIPDRIPYAQKRAVRAELPPAEEQRARELRELHARAVLLGNWPESLEPAPCQPVDHVRAFGLHSASASASASDRPTGDVLELVPGGIVTGTLAAAAGPDLHLAVEGRGVLVLDTRLMAGWDLVPLDAANREFTVPVKEFEQQQQQGLF